MDNNKVESTSISAFLVLFASQIAIGASGIFARFAMHGTGPAMVSALRLTIASFILLAIYLRSNRQKVERRHELLFLFCGLALAAHFATWMASLCYVSVAIATLIISTAPLWTTLYDLVVLKQRPTATFWLGFGAAALGTVLIVAPSQADLVGRTSHSVLFGEILAAIGGLAFAFYLIAIRGVSLCYPTLTIITRTYSWSAAFLWIAALCVGDSVPGVNVESWAGILAMALVVQVFGHTCINVSLKTFSPRVVALSTLLEPVIAGVLAAILFRESLSPQMVLGSVILLGSLALALTAPGI